MYMIYAIKKTLMNTKSKINMFLDEQVFRQSLWMMHFGVSSMKPTCLWSNSSHIQRLDDGPVPKDVKKTAKPLATTYTDAHGVKRCVVKKRELKESQFLSSMVAFSKFSYHFLVCCLGANWSDFFARFGT